MSKKTQPRGRASEAKAESRPVSQNRRPGRKPYPVVVFEEALKIPKGIMQHAAGNSVRRLRLLDLMDLSPTMQSTRELITNSGKYGLTIGNHGAEELKLTEEGKVVVDPQSSTERRASVSFSLAIMKIEHFAKLYGLYAGRTMPSLEVMQDSLEDLNEGDRRPCVDVFVGNAKYLGLLKTIGGTVHLLKLEDISDSLLEAEQEGQPDNSTIFSVRRGQGQDATQHRSIKLPDYSNTCFFIAPIGDKWSDDAVRVEQRQHSDTILNQYIRRALDEQSLTVVRADEIAEAGMISRQIIEYILHSRLVIADLSYSNPNVFYELCLRHVSGKPTVHLVREGDRIPFDVANFRTITIALGDVHRAIAEIDTHRAEISNHVRQAISAGESTDNPILSFFPKARLNVD